MCSALKPLLSRNMLCCGKARCTPCQASFLQQVRQPVKVNTGVADQIQHQEHLRKVLKENVISPGGHDVQNADSAPLKKPIEREGTQQKGKTTSVTRTSSIARFLSTVT